MADLSSVPIPVTCTGAIPFTASVSPAQVVAWAERAGWKCRAERLTAYLFRGRSGVATVPNGDREDPHFETGLYERRMVRAIVDIAIEMCTSATALLRQIAGLDSDALHRYLRNRGATLEREGRFGADSTYRYRGALFVVFEGRPAEEYRVVTAAIAAAERRPLEHVEADMRGEVPCPACGAWDDERGAGEVDEEEALPPTPGEPIGLRAHIRDLERHIDFLAGVLTRRHRIERGEGGRIEEGPVLDLIARALLDIVEPAPNQVSFTIEGRGEDTRSAFVLISKPDGTTTEELRLKAVDERDAALARVAELEAALREAVHEMATNEVGFSRSVTDQIDAALGDRR